MSFGGGGSGSGAITAHLHTNAAGEGGSLNTTSLINDVPIYSTIVAMG